MQRRDADPRLFMSTRRATSISSLSQRWGGRGSQPLLMITALDLFLRFSDARKCHSGSHLEHAWDRKSVRIHIKMNYLEWKEGGGGGR